MKSIPVGTYGGMKVRAKPSAFVLTAALAVIVMVIALTVFDASIGVAIVAGLALAVMHMALEVWHQYGHYRAGIKVGYPMALVVLWMLLGKSIYPKDEPELPARIHIQRALGGPTYSFYFSLVAALIALILYALSTDLFWIPLYACLHNLAIFTVGAFIPLHVIGIETDGTTLLRWWGKRRLSEI